MCLTPSHKANPLTVTQLVRTKYGIICINPFPSKPWFLRVFSTNLLKTQWEKEKLLVMSDFSYSLGVFYQLGKCLPLPFSTDVKLFASSFNLEVLNLSFGKGLTHYQTKFRLVQIEKSLQTTILNLMKISEFSKQLEKTVGKGEIARYEQFLLFPQCFQKACFTGVLKGVIVWEWVKKALEGSNESGLLQQVVFKCRFYQVDLKRVVVSEL